VPNTSAGSNVATFSAAPTASALEAFAECLSAVASSAGLLTGGSALSQAVAVDLVRAETARALQLPWAVRVLDGDVRVGRARVSPRAVLERAVAQTETERRLRRLHVQVDRDGRDCPEVEADEELLASALSGLLVGLAVYAGYLCGKLFEQREILPHVDVVYVRDVISQEAGVPLLEVQR